MTRLPEVYGSVWRVAVISKYIAYEGCGCIAVVRVGLVMCGRIDEYIESSKFEMSLFLWYFSRSALKSPSKTNVLLSRESFSKGFVTLT